MIPAVCEDQIDSARLHEVARLFQLAGALRHARRYGSGHIHDTFLADCESGGVHFQYIFQRINDRVFPDVPGLMRNVWRVTSHVRQRLLGEGVRDVDRRVLTLVSGRDHAWFARDRSGAPWRVFHFVPGARSYDVPESAGRARGAARAFGRFQSLLSDFPAADLCEVLPGFHDTPARLARLEAAVCADAVGRVSSVRREIEWARAGASFAGRLTDLQRRGVVPVRVTHNDTKLNNVLFDVESGEALCVTDLDTVMPGLVLYDFGDMVRAAASSAAEDEPDVGRVQFRVDFFEAMVAGYLESAGVFLTRPELEHLAFSAVLITFECGVRFLTDYLEGDLYFRTNRPGQNLDRCRTQFRLVEQMQHRMKDLEGIVDRESAAVATRRGAAS